VMPMPRCAGCRVVLPGRAAPYVETRDRQETSCPTNTNPDGSTTTVWRIESFPLPPGAQDAKVFCSTTHPAKSDFVWCSAALGQGKVYCQIYSYASSEERAQQLLGLMLAPAARRLRQLPA